MSPKEALGPSRSVSLSVSAALGLLALGIGLTAACGSVGSAPVGGPGADGGDASTLAEECPSTAPASKSACSVEGLSCSYECKAGGPAKATCTAGAWGVVHYDSACPVEEDGGPPPVNAPFACGQQSCGVNQYCLQPCCGGPAPLCEPLGDGGGCAAGFHPANCRNGPGCEMDPCTPPPARCVDDPKTQPGCAPQNGSRYLVCVCA